MNITNKKYLYLLSSPKEYEELCLMEMRHIFDEPTSHKYHLTNEDIDVSRSAFIKSKVTILYSAKDISTIEEQMNTDDLHFDEYKIHYIKYDSVPYQDRLDIMRTLGYAIIGTYNMQRPINEFVITKINDVWIFGKLKKNPNKYLTRRDKPHNYSNALDTVLAKALINIAIDNDFSLKLVDPCCGIGTVLIEGRALGIDIIGYEISPLVKINCNKNLEHFGFKPDTKKIDMLKTNKHFDVAILDLPYGQFSFVTKDEQIALLKKTKEISDKSIIITMDDMSETLASIGYKILEKCQIKKSNAFSRYVSICTS